MEKQNIDALMERWESGAAFRSALRRDAEAAVRAAGITLNDEERAALGAIDWSLSDKQLSARASKYRG